VRLDCKETWSWFWRRCYMVKASLYASFQTLKLRKVG
jgi:hypothetical protein